MIAVTIPAVLFISANDRLHWAVKAKRVREIRTIAACYTRGHTAPTPAHLDVLIHRPKGGALRDAENAAPTVKAALDGCRDSGVIPEDDRRTIVAVTYRIAPKNRTDSNYLFEFTFTSQEITW